MSIVHVRDILLKNVEKGSGAVISTQGYITVLQFSFQNVNIWHLGLKNNFWLKFPEIYFLPFGIFKLVCAFLS